MKLRGPWIEHLTEDEGLTYPQACDYLDPYECVPYVENDEHMATLLKNKAEVHFCIYRKYRRKGYVTLRRIREFLLPLLEREGFLITKLGHGEPERFIRRLGFEQIGATASHRIYMLNTIPLLEKHHDQT